MKRARGVRWQVKRVMMSCDPLDHWRGQGGAWPSKESAVRNEIRQVESFHALHPEFEPRRYIFLVGPVDELDEARWKRVRYTHP